MALIDHIHHNVYLSSRMVLNKLELVRNEGIKAVVRLDHASTFGMKVTQWPRDEFKLLYLPFDDGGEVLSDYFSQVTAFIHQQAKTGSKVLVHCQMGISRSTTMVLAYLIEHHNMTLPQAWATVHDRRPIAAPHPSLMRSLVKQYTLPYRENDIEGYQFLERLYKEAQADGE